MAEENSSPLLLTGSGVADIEGRIWQAVYKEHESFDRDDQKERLRRELIEFFIDGHFSKTNLSASHLKRNELISKAIMASNHVPEPTLIRSVRDFMCSIIQEAEEKWRACFIPKEEISESE